MNRGCKYGSHRVLEPLGVLPQPALRLDNDMSKQFDNEILVDVTTLSIDSASFTQIEAEAGHDVGRIAARIMAIVDQRGKMQNSATGGGGLFIGTVASVGQALNFRGLAIGDRIASLVSLSLSPLRIDQIFKIQPEINRVEIQGQALLFESSIYTRLPDDMDEGLVLSALDVAGAPAQAAKHVKAGNSVLIIGAGGKSGMLVAHEAMKRVGPTGRVVGNVILEEDRTTLNDLRLCHDVVVSDATRAVAFRNAALKPNGGREYDVVFNCVNVPNTELSTILSTRDEGVACFFSLATNFAKAALGAEGVGKDITMLIGNGYTKGHAEIALWGLRENPGLRKLFEARYASTQRIQ